MKSGFPDVSCDLLIEVRGHQFTLQYEPGLAGSAVKLGFPGLRSLAVVAGEAFRCRHPFLSLLPAQWPVDWPVEIRVGGRLLGSFASVGKALSWARRGKE